MLKPGGQEGPALWWWQVSLHPCPWLLHQVGAADKSIFKVDFQRLGGSEVRNSYSGGEKTIQEEVASGERDEKDSLLSWPHGRNQGGGPTCSTSMTLFLKSQRY